MLNKSFFAGKEELFVGVNRTASKINLYCNLQTTFQSNITYQYCRFVRGDQRIYLHLKEGLSDGKYSYYGTGLRHGECGLTIEKPDSADMTVWKCQLGLIKHMGERNISETRDSVVYLPTDRSEDLYGDESEEINVLAGIGEHLILMCQAKVRLKYCWFRHPDNTTVFNTDRVQNPDIS